MVRSTVLHGAIPATSAEDFHPIRAPRGPEITCKGWQQEAALRMLMNNLDPEVAERPQDLVVYGGSGKAARNWECYHAIVGCLKALENYETLEFFRETLHHMKRFFRVRPEAVRALKDAGFKFVSVDLEPFRTGRLNEAAGLVPLRK